MSTEPRLVGPTPCEWCRGVYGGHDTWCPNYGAGVSLPTGEKLMTAPNAVLNCRVAVKGVNEPWRWVCEPGTQNPLHWNRVAADEWVKLVREAATSAVFEIIDSPPYHLPMSRYRIAMGFHNDVYRDWIGSGTAGAQNFETSNRQEADDKWDEMRGRHSDHRYCVVVGPPWEFPTIKTVGVSERNYQVAHKMMGHPWKWLRSSSGANPSKYSLDAAHAVVASNKEHVLDTEWQVVKGPDFQLPKELAHPETEPKYRIAMKDPLCNKWTWFYDGHVFDKPDALRNQDLYSSRYPQNQYLLVPVPDELPPDDLDVTSMTKPKKLVDTGEVVDFTKSANAKAYRLAVRPAWTQGATWQWVANLDINPVDGLMQADAMQLLERLTLQNRDYAYQVVIGPPFELPAVALTETWKIAVRSQPFGDWSWMCNFSGSSEPLSKEDAQLRKKSLQERNPKYQYQLVPGPNFQLPIATEKRCTIQAEDISALMGLAEWVHDKVEREENMLAWMTDADISQKQHDKQRYKLQTWQTFADALDNVVKQVES